MVLDAESFSPAEPIVAMICHRLSLRPLGLAESAGQFGLHSPFHNWHQLLLKPAAHHRPQQLADKIFKGPVFATHWKFGDAAWRATYFASVGEAPRRCAGGRGGKQPLLVLGHHRFSRFVRLSL